MRLMRHICDEAKRLPYDRCIAIGVSRFGWHARLEDPYRRTESKTNFPIAFLQCHGSTRRGIVMASLLYYILHKPFGFLHIHTQHIAEIYDPRNTMLSAEGNSNKLNTHFAFRANSSLTPSKRSMQACQACALLSGTTDLMRILKVPLTGR